MFKDYFANNGMCYTIRPLPLLKREELTTRYNTFNKYKKIGVQIIDKTIEYNLKQILALYELDINNFDVSEFDDLIVNYILPVNFSKLTYDEKPTNKKTSESEKKNPEENYLEKLFASVWAITENAGDALYLINNIPAEFLLNIINYRVEDLEKMYMTEDDKRKKEKQEMRQKFLDKGEGILDELKRT